MNISRGWATRCGIVRCGITIASGSNKGEIFARESNQAVETVLLVRIWKVGQPGHQEPAGNTRTILLSSSASYRHTPSPFH